MELKRIDVTSSLMAYDEVLAAARSEGREPNTADRMLAMRAAIAAYEADKKKEGENED